MNLLLEIPVCTSEAALKAIEHGVDRLEICSGFEVGGVTPWPGMASYLRSKTDTPLFVMIRLRSGDFINSCEELEVIKWETCGRSMQDARGSGLQRQPVKKIGITFGSYMQTKAMKCLRLIRQR